MSIKSYQYLIRSYKRFHVYLKENQCFFSEIYYVKKNKLIMGSCFIIILIKTMI